MKVSLVAREPNGQGCIDCAVRRSSICAALDQAELRELDDLGRHVQFVSRETVFAQEELTTSFYNLLEGVCAFTSCCLTGAGRYWDLLCPATSWGWRFPPVIVFPPMRSARSPCAGSPRTTFVRFVEDKPHL